MEASRKDNSKVEATKGTERRAEVSRICGLDGVKAISKKIKSRCWHLLIQSLHFVPSYQGWASLTRRRRIESQSKTNEEVKQQQKQTKKNFVHCSVTKASPHHFHLLFPPINFSYCSLSNNKPVGSCCPPPPSIWGSGHCFLSSPLFRPSKWFCIVRFCLQMPSSFPSPLNNTLPLGTRICFSKSNNYNKDK